MKTAFRRDKTRIAAAISTDAYSGESLAKARNKTLDRILYAAARVGAMFIEMIPMALAYSAARLAGDAIYALDRRHRRRALEHLRLSFPHWSRARRGHIARQSFRSLACLGVEMVLTPRLLTLDRWRRHIRFGDMKELLELRLRGNCPLILVSGHFGNWEVLGYTMAALGFPSIAVARRLDNPHIDRHVLGMRQKTGMTVVGKKGASVPVDSALAGGGAVGFMADQDAGRRGLFVDFFGRPASTFKSIALLAMRYHAPVAVVFGRRIGGEFLFDIGVCRIIRPEEWQDKPDPAMWITLEYTAALEKLVRDCPGQYLWAHRRWKHTPP